MIDIKKLFVKILTSPLFGKLIEIVTNDRISFRDVLIHTGHSEISTYIKACLFWGIYEKQEAIFVQRYLPANLPVIELGASIGVISAITARKIFPQTLYAVEANPALISTIEDNLKLNKAVNFEILNLAVGSSTQLFFTPGADNTVGSISDSRSSNSVPVECLSLSAIIAKLNLARFNLVCDIEGSEFDFLFLDASSLENCEWMIIELHEKMVSGRLVSVRDLIDQMKNLGFSIVDGYGPVVVAHNSNQVMGKISA